VSEQDKGGRRAAGELESNVLAVLWQADGPLTAAQVNEALPDGLAYTTVLTILARLHAKGALTRERAGRGYAYRPVRDEATHTAEQMVTLLDRGRDRQAVLTQFVSELSSEDEELLQQLLRGDHDR
jgi:predicted transcriptional regulator